MSRIVAFALVLGLASSAQALTPGTDVRVDVQALIDATPSGGLLVLPDGDYLVTRAGSAYWSLRIPAGVTVRGSGATVLRQAAGMDASVRLVQMDGANAALERITLDGNASLQTADEHRSGVFVAASGVVLRNVTARNFTGDGFVAHVGASSLTLDGCAATGNQRNGFTMSAPMTDIVVRGGTYSGNAVQQIDSEPVTGAVANVTINGATIDIGTTDGQAITVSGISSSTRSSSWRIVGNLIRGQIFVVWADDVVIAGNGINNPSTWRDAVWIYRNSTRVTVARNLIIGDNPYAVGAAGVHVDGAGAPNSPDAVVIAQNTISMYSPTSYGIRANGCLTVAIVDNVLTGAGLSAPYYVGIYLRATDPSMPFALVTLSGNTIAGFGHRGIDVRGSGASQLTMLRAIGNTIGSANAAQWEGINLDGDGAHALQGSVLVGNSYGTGVTTGRL